MSDILLIITSLVIIVCAVYAFFHLTRERIHVNEKLIAEVAAIIMKHFPGQGEVNLYKDCAIVILDKLKKD